MSSRLSVGWIAAFLRAERYDDETLRAVDDKIEAITRSRHKHD